MKTVITASVDVEVVTRVRKLLEANAAKQSTIEVPAVTVKKAVVGSANHRKQNAEIQLRKDALAQREAIPTKLSSVVEHALIAYLETNGQSK